MKVSSIPAPTVFSSPTVTGVLIVTAKELRFTLLEGAKTEKGE